MQGLDGWKIPAVTSLNFSIPRRTVPWNCFIGSCSTAFPDFLVSLCPVSSVAVQHYLYSVLCLDFDFDCLIS